MNKLTIRQNALNASSSLPALLKGDTRILPVPLIPRIHIENQWSPISNPTIRKVYLSKTSKQPGAGLWFSPCLNFIDTDYFQLLVVFPVFFLSGVSSYLHEYCFESHIGPLVNCRMPPFSWSPLLCFLSYSGDRSDCA